MLYNGGVANTEAALPEKITKTRGAEMKIVLDTKLKHIDDNSEKILDIKQIISNIQDLSMHEFVIAANDNTSLGSSDETGFDFICLHSDIPIDLSITATFNSQSTTIANFKQITDLYVKAPAPYFHATLTNNNNTPAKVKWFSSAEPEQE